MPRSIWRGGADLSRIFSDLDLILTESGGDNLAATFSPELDDLSIYVIDTAEGQDIPRKKGPGVTRSDLLVVNKTDLAPYVNVDLAMLESDTKAARGARPYVMANLSRGQGIDQILAFFVGRGRFNFNLNQRFPLCAFLRRGSIRGDLGG